MPLHQSITFSLELPAPPARYIPLYDLEEALLSKRLGGKLSPRPLRCSYNLLTKRRHWGRRAAPVGVRKLKAACTSDLLASLKSGELVTVCHVARTCTFYRIPSSFWNSKYAGLAGGGTLLKYDQVRVLPEEAYGNQIYVPHRFALRWLKARGITEREESFPEALREERNTRSSAKRPEDRVIKEELRKMTQEEGMTAYAAAEEIKNREGFEKVGTALARDLGKGINRPGPRTRTP